MRGNFRNFHTVYHRKKIREIVSCFKAFIHHFALQSLQAFSIKLDFDPMEKCLSFYSFSREIAIKRNKKEGPSNFFRNQLFSNIFSSKMISRNFCDKSVKSTFLRKFVDKCELFSEKYFLSETDFCST